LCEELNFIMLKPDDAKKSFAFWFMARAIGVVCGTGRLGQLCASAIGSSGVYDFSL
jgi:hypothetical protein